MGHGGEIEYDFEGLERSIEERFVKNKPRLLADVCPYLTNLYFNSFKVMSVFYADLKWNLIYTPPTMTFAIRLTCLFLCRKKLLHSKLGLVFKKIMLILSEAYYMMPVENHV